MPTLVERSGVAMATRHVRFGALVVVPDKLAREAVVRQLNALGAPDVLEAATVAEARLHLRSLRGRDLCVVEARLPDGSGIGLLAELRTAGWARGLVLASAEDPYTVRAALAAGVRSFVVSAPAAIRIPSARRPSEGGITPVRTRRGGSGPEGLSAREIEVLDLVGHGQSNRDIGTSLGLSALTVKSHLARISRKLGTGDRAEMVVVALRAGLIV